MMTSLKLPVDGRRPGLDPSCPDSEPYNFYTQSHSRLLLLGSRAYRRPDVLGKIPVAPSSSYLLIPIPGSLDQQQFLSNHLCSQGDRLLFRAHTVHN